MIYMPYDFSLLNVKIKEIEEWLSREFSTVRTGRATPAILDNVKVDSYGAKVAINHVAGITVEDARSLRVTPWDRAHIKEIEKSIQAEDLGLSVTIDDSGLRVIFPELTAERREQLKKLVGNKHEEAKISLKRAREETWNDIQKKEKGGELSEDEKFRLKDEMQKIIDETNKRFNEMEERKEKEILEK